MGMDGDKVVLGAGIAGSTAAVVQMARALRRRDALRLVQWQRIRVLAHGLALAAIAHHLLARQ